MRVLLVGGGGREHALAWKLAQSPRLSRLYAAPGNPGIARVAECVAVRAEAVGELAALAERERVDLVVVGPEVPLALGLADLLTGRGIPVVGPTRNAAELESSKIFAKSLFARHRIPTARFATFEEAKPARAFARDLGGRVVVKADGLAAGKGAIVCADLAEADRALGDLLDRRTLGEAGARVVVEERLEGEEVSVFVLTDGERVCPLAVAQDHKAVFDGDQGPNTGGMGAYSPAPVVTPAIHEKAMAEVLRRTVDGMAAEGRPYRGVLYAGLMIDGESVKTLEFNARFGDPECQPLLMRMKSDIVPILLAVAEGDLSGVEIEWHDKAAVCVVMASQGYPGDYRKGDEISGLDEAARIDDLFVFHAGTKVQGGKTVTGGGRVLGVTALGDTVQDAIDRAYRGVAAIKWEGVHYRRDIGRKAVERPLIVNRES